MTEFCEGCPMRNSANGKLVVALHAPLQANGQLAGQVFTGVAGVLMDAEGGISKLTAMPDTMEGRESLYPLVDSCGGPKTREKGLFKRHEVITGCAALGELAVADSAISQRFTQVVKAEALKVAANLPPELKGE